MSKTKEEEMIRDNLLRKMKEGEEKKQRKSKEKNWRENL